MTDTEMVDMIQLWEVWLTFASSEVPARRWRAYCEPRQFATPDLRERMGRVGYGSTPREAMLAFAKCVPTFDAESLKGTEP